MTLRKTLVVVVAAGLAWLGAGCGVDPTQEAPPLERTALAAPLLSGLAGSYGDAVAVGGGLLAVSSPGEVPSAIHLYARAGRGWVEDGLLTGLGGGVYKAMLLEEGRLVVGQPWAGAEGRGQVLVFRRHAGAWGLEAAIDAPADGPRRFGTAVALTGEHLFVGAPGGPEAGAVFAFARHRGWAQEARITPSTRVEGDLFGDSLAADGAGLAVSVRSGPGNAVVVFRERPLARAGWREEALLVEPGGEPDAYYARRIAMAGGIIAVACGCPDGEVWVYRRTGHGWRVEQELAAPFAVTYTGMAHELRLSPAGHWLVTSAPYAEVEGLGAAGIVLVYERGPRGWSLRHQLHAPTPAASATFGHALALDGHVLAVGAPGDAGQAGEVLTISLAGP